MRTGRLGAGAAVVVVVGLLVAGLVDDVLVRARLHHMDSRLAATRALLSATARRLSSTTADAQRTDQGGASTRSALTQVTAELATAKQLLRRAQTGMDAGTIELGAVHNCAGGVSRSASALEAGNQSQAVAALSAVAAACESMLGSGAGAPVYPFDFADPDVVLARSTYYAYGTNSTAGNIQVMESTDLRHWKKAGNALPALASWAAPGRTWAPAVIHLERSYLLYYTVARARGGVLCLSVATARRPQGPFVDQSSAPLECQPALGGSIDPAPVLDAGHLYLVWKSNGNAGQPATIWAQALDRQGTALTGPGPVALLRPGQPWEGAVIEAPSFVRIGATYFLFYSANNWNSADYAVGVARCAGILGPCAKPLSQPLLGSQADLAGPGGADVFTDGQGQLQMAFQAWLPGAVGYPHPRLFFLRRLVLAGGIPRVAPPG